ncbi:MAG: ParB/RepB/Spo0J family partition protein [Isosphaeraceae bacterium]|nr:ParB/RepB/Spo0J family partition protein [Isosphaeraceae bacterium]
MGKLEELLRANGGNAAESMGAGVTRGDAMRGAYSDNLPPTPDRVRGLVKVKNVAEIPLDKIDRDPEQPREEFDEEGLARLAESLKSRGQLQPVRVRWDEGRGVYLLLCGERRWRAARLAGLPAVTAVIQDGPVRPDEMLAIQLIENAQREDLRPIEQARAYKRLMDLYGWTATRVGEELAITQGAVSKALKLLELPETIQEQVEQGSLSPDSGYEISKLADAADQIAIASRVVAEKIGRDALRAVVKERTGRPSKPLKEGRERFLYRDDDGSVVTITGPVLATSPAAIVALLRKALRHAQSNARDTTRGEAA